MVDCILDKDFLKTDHEDFWKSSEFRAVQRPSTLEEKILRKNLIAQYAATLENNPKFAAEFARNALRRAELLKGILTQVG